MYEKLIKTTSGASCDYGLLHMYACAHACTHTHFTCHTWD